MSFDKDKVEEFYIMALMDIADGASVDDMEEVLIEYERAEMYEACAGILKAINESKYYTIKDINKKLNDSKFKND